MNDIVKQLKCCKSRTSEVFALVPLVMAYFIAGTLRLFVQPNSALLKAYAFHKAVLLGRITHGSAWLHAPGMLTTIWDLVQRNEAMVVLVNLFVADCTGTAADEEEEEVAGEQKAKP